MWFRCRKYFSLKNHTAFILFQQPSSNYDDSGFFSIQVIQEAVRVWGLELVPFTSSNDIAQQARQDPTYVFFL